MRQLSVPASLVLIRGGEGFLFGMIFAATMVYMIESGLSPIELVLVGTALETAAFLFEIPTGIVADQRSRRLSVAIGFGITGGAYLLMGLVPTFVAIASASALWGLGYTFTSGAIDAWLVDEIGQPRAEPLLARSARISALAGIAGTLAGMGLGSIVTALPIVVGGAFFVLLAALVRLLVPERGFAPQQYATRDRLRRFVGVLADGLRSVRGSAVLVAMTGLTVLFGAFSEGFDRLRDARLIRGIGIPEPFDAVVWIGIISIATRLMVSFAAHALERRTPKMDRPGRLLAGLLLTVALAVIVFAWASSFPLALAVLVVGGTSRGLIDPIRSIWINRHIPSPVRATVLSTYGQADSIGQIALGPAIGLLATRAGLPLALSVAAAVLLPTAVVALASNRRKLDGEIDA